MSPAAATATATAFAAVSVAAPNPTVPSRGRVHFPFRGVTATPRRATASMPVSAPRSGAAAASFLERRESERALHCVKYQGLGNDFIMVDNRDSSVPKVTPEEAAKLCDRNFGIGADGVIFVMPGVNGADYTMRIFNSDGSEPEMCGNGVRCFARFIAEIENLQGTNSFTIHTGAGKIIPEIQSDGQVRVDMGEPILSGPDIPTKLLATNNKAVVQAELPVEGLIWHVTCVSMGNPHCVPFGAKELKVLQVDDLKLSEIGPKFEHHEMFPARTDTEFVQDLSRSHLVWERGAGATIVDDRAANHLRTPLEVPNQDDVAVRIPQDVSQVHNRGLGIFAACGEWIRKQKDMFLAIFLLSCVFSMYLFFSGFMSSRPQLGCHGCCCRSGGVVVVVAYM